MDQTTGMESQVRVLKTYCEQNNIPNVEFFCDEGISGTKSSRPALDHGERQIHHIDLFVNMIGMVAAPSLGKME